MYAYAFDGTPIVSTKEAVPGTCDVLEGTFSIVDGELAYEACGGTAVDWNGQETVTDRGQEVFYDANDREWPACALVLVENEVDPDAEDEADRAVPAGPARAAREAYDAWRASAPFVATVAAPVEGWGGTAEMTTQERALLSPIAATLAMLSGRSAAEIAGDPLLVEAMLPTAKALATANGATVGMLADAPALFPSSRVPLPSFVKGREVVDLADGAGVALVELVDVEWDDDGQGVDLPTSMIAAVTGEWDDDGGIADMLSDAFGFCVSGIGSTTQVDRAGDPVGLS